jgi:hypothetical protein
MKKTDNIKQKIYQNIANNSQVVDHLEQILIDQRGYVYKIPIPHTPVIMLFSGGLDTIAVTNILLEKYKLIIYPLYINRRLPHSRQTNKSVAFFNNYFLKKYPKLFNPVFEVNLKIPAPEIKHILLSAENDPVKIQGQTGYKQGIPLQPAIYANTAFHYAKYLNKKNSLNIKNIFGAWLPANSVWFAYESFQALRSIMVNLCVIDNDYSWQFCSLPLEPELDNFLEKEDLIKIVSQYKLPLEKTWTCWRGGSHQCGCCGNCYARKEAFQKAGIIDKTIYGQNFIDKIIESIQFRYSPNR